MIITKQKPIEEVLEALGGKKKIFLVGCGECSTTCRAGGEEEVKVLVERLGKEEKDILGWVVPEAPCICSQVKANFAKSRKLIKDAEAMLVLACGLGVQSVAENGRFAGPVYAGCNTLFAGGVRPDGSFFEYCSLCAECVLNKTAAICPVTRCSKGMLNGPCGGTNKGKCEVDTERDCAWTLIYRRLEELGELDRLHQIMPPKAFSKTTKPRTLNVTV